MIDWYRRRRRAPRRDRRRRDRRTTSLQRALERALGVAAGDPAQVAARDRDHGAGRRDPRAPRCEHAAAAVRPGHLDGGARRDRARSSSARTRARRRRSRACTDFPAASCISINEEIVHGIPSAQARAQGRRHRVARRRRAATRATSRTPRSRCRWARSTTRSQRLLDVTRARAGGGHRRGARREPHRRHRRGDRRAWWRPAGFTHRARPRGPRRRRPSRTRSRRCRTTASRSAGRSCSPGLTIAIEPMVNVGQVGDADAERQVDDRDARRLALGALRAHGGDHGGRAAGTDLAAGTGGTYVEQSNEP